MVSLKTKIFATVTTCALLSAGSFAGDAKAQESYMPPADQQQQSFDAQPQPEINVSDNELKSFVKAHEAVNDVHTQFQGEAAAVTSQEEMAAVQQQATEQMVEVIEDVGLTVDQYNLIMSAIQTDPSVQARFTQIAQQ